MAENDNPFAAFGGRVLEEPSDPFAAFGGKAIEETPSDPFAAFGGKALKEEEQERGKPVLDTEIAAIAKKHNLPPEAYTDYLRSVVEFRGGSTETPVDFAKAARQVGAFVGEAVFYGAPQFIQKKMEDDPRIRAAIDDLGALVEERKTYTRTAAELGVGLLTGAAETKLAAGAIKAGAKAIGKEVTEAAIERAAIPAVAAGVGATVGVAKSREGEEVTGAAMGAATGLVLSTAVTAAAKGISSIRNRKVQQEAQQIAEEMAQSPDMVAKIQDEVQKETGMKEVVDVLVQKQVAEPGSQAVANSINRIDALVEQVGEERIVKAGQQILENMSDEVREQTTKELAGFGTELQRMASLVQQELDTALPKLAEALGERAGSAREALQTIASRAGEGAEYISKRYQGVLEKDAHERLLNAKLIERALGGSGEATVAQTVLAKVKDYQFVFRRIDKKFGTRLEVTLNNWNERYNAYTRHMAAKAKDLENVTQIVQKSGITENELYNALNRPDVVQFTAGPKKAAVDAYKTFFDTAREEANALGMNIAKREYYVPHGLKERVEISRVMRARINEIEKEFKINLLSYDQKAYENAVKADMDKSPLYRELKDALDHLYGDVIGTPDKLQDFLASQINPRTAGVRSYSKAAAAYRRTAEEVPTLIRETNVNKLAVRWLGNTLKHAYMRNSFSEVEVARDMLMKQGFKDEAEGLTRWLTDNLGGTREKTWGAFVQNIQNNLLNMAEKGGNKARLANYLLEAGPNNWMRITNAVYPNFLGYSIRPVLQNVAQPFLLTVPELGAVLGPAYILRTLPKTANLKSFFQLASKYRAAQWNSENIGILESQMKRSLGGKATDAVIKANTRMAMALYELSEVLNRGFVANMGKELAKDVLDPAAMLHKKANAFIDGMGQGVRNQIREAIAANNVVEVERLIINNLMDKTIFQYNRGAMSEYARTVGPALAVFTKFPTAFVGDVAEAYEDGLTKGTIKNLRKYVGPLILLATANAAMNEGKPFTQENEQMAALIGGKKGLTTLSPMMALGQGIGVPPMLKSGVKLAKAAVSGDINMAVKGLTSVGDAYMPALPGILRALNEASVLTTGEEIEVKNLETLLEAVTE